MAKIICKKCGEEVEEEETIEVYMKGENGQYEKVKVCKHCCENSFSQCEDCKEYFETEDMILTANGLVCENCLEENYAQCEECGEYYRTDDMRYVDNCGGYVCEDCFSENWYICDRCGEYIRGSDTYFYDDEPYCEVCYNYVCDEDDERILGYHGNRGDWTSYKTEDERGIDNDKLRFIGFELEVEHKEDSHGNQRKAIDKIQENINCYLEHDGSLNDGGFEIVSQPQTYNYIMQQFGKYKETFDRLIELGYISHNSSHCGLHFHVTAPKSDIRNDVVSRLWLIIENFKDEFEKISRRSGNFEWCHFLSNTSDATDDMLEGIYKMKKVYKNGQRYLVINNENTKTLEIRLFRGTLRAETFFADLQLVNNLFNLAYDLNIKLKDITWAKLTEGEYIQAYCEQHKIYSKKRIKDNSMTFVTLENKAKRFTRQIYNEYAKYFKSKEFSYYKMKKFDNKNMNLFRDSIYQYISNASDLSSLDYELNKNTMDWSNILDHINSLRQRATAYDFKVDINKIDSLTYVIKDCVNQL